MIKRIICRWLLKLTTPDLKITEVNQDQIKIWLENTGEDPKFYEYFKFRDITLLKTMAVGLSREDYLLNVGRRIELLTLLQKVDEAHKVMEAKRKKQVEEDKKKAEERRLNTPNQ